jgi:hypothetical protein
MNEKTNAFIHRSAFIVHRFLSKPSILNPDRHKCAAKIGVFAHSDAAKIGRFRPSKMVSTADAPLLRELYSATVRDGALL